MARVAIVSYDVQTIRGKAGGVGAFVTRLADLLRSAGDDVTIVMTRTDWEPMSVDPEWKALYQARGIGLIELQSPPASTTRWPEVAPMRISEIAAPILRGFDIVYLQDWGNPGFHLLRDRRYSIEQGPVCVTVLHGPSEWELSSNHEYPDLPADLHLSYLERYAAQYSDFVVSPSAYMVRHLSYLGWQFPGGVQVLGLPMPVPAAAPALPTPQIRKIVYFGRIEERKGIRLFVKALQLLATTGTARPEIVLLGSTKTPELLDSSLKALKTSGYSVTHLASLNAEQAAKYLRSHATETLCVIPSPSDNFPYTVVEASLIPGLNLIASTGGGIGEILQGAEAQLAAPYPAELAAKMEERLRAPLAPADITHYDCAAANERWLHFHRRALASAPSRVPRTLPASKLTVDVVTTFYNKAPYLGQFVDALEHQTETDFHVIAVNDGSTEDTANRVFDEQSKRAAQYGWDFFTQENAFVDAARNNATRRGTGDLLLFIDSDDIPARNAVARMRDAIALSGDDALICGSYLFASAKLPYGLATGEVTAPAYATCVPLGMNLVGGLLDPSSFGGSMFMVRRSVFEALGGFTELRGAGHEDWELYVRIALAGYRVDVIPDLLQFYRQVEGSLARTLPSDASKRRLLNAYEEKASAAGLPGAALALAGLYQRSKDQDAEIRSLSAKMQAPQAGYSFFSANNKGFEPEGHGINSSRLQQWYRSAFSLETRLKIHRVLLARFVGPYEPPSL